MIEFDFYNHIHPKLKPYISHYWFASGSIKRPDYLYLLPTNHIEIIIPLTEYCVYYYNNELTEFGMPHIHGIRSSAVPYLRYHNPAIIGISFKPWGFYAFADIELSKTKDKILPVNECCITLSNSLDWGNSKKNKLNIVDKLETSLIQALKTPIPPEHIQIINHFASQSPDNIQEFCTNHPINLRTLERYCKKYIGLTPKSLLKLQQFEKASRDIIYNNASTSLTDISTNHGYYDQSHFIKAFKKYVGVSPSIVNTNKPALKSHLNFKK